MRIWVVFCCFTNMIITYVSIFTCGFHDGPHCCLGSPHLIEDATHRPHIHFGPASGGFLTGFDEPCMKNASNMPAVPVLRSSQKHFWRTVPAPLHRWCTVAAPLPVAVPIHWGPQGKNVKNVSSQKFYKLKL